MKITAIKQQVKRPDRFSIYADKVYVFSLGEAGLLQMGLYVGLEFDLGKLELLKTSADFDKLYDASLRYIAIRLRSEWEMAQYLKRKHASGEDASLIMEKLRERRWLSDEAFARSWVSNRRQLKAVSKRRLQQELRAKRVSDSVVSVVLADDEVEDSTSLAALIQKKRQHSRYQDQTKLMQYLIRQGFSYQDVKSALQDTSEEL